MLHFGQLTLLQGLTPAEQHIYPFMSFGFYMDEDKGLHIFFEDGLKLFYNR